MQGINRLDREWILTFMKGCCVYFPSEPLNFSVLLDLKWLEPDVSSPLKVNVSVGFFFSFTKLYFVGFVASPGQKRCNRVNRLNIFNKLCKVRISRHVMFLFLCPKHVRTFLFLSFKKAGFCCCHLFLGNWIQNTITWNRIRCISPLSNKYETFHSWK